ncbi:CinA family protein [Marinobacter sp. C2H3]|uniref:CinA family protein n=1 Tax=Marinobacter sp. C2H3 TaxID=3119003 RepID=UPI00300EED10
MTTIVTDQQLQEAGEQLGLKLEATGLTVATAESCTGGWVAKVLTDRAGCSAYTLAGLVTYSNQAKETVLGVAPRALDNHGAVSEPVVRQMVAGAARLAGADLAVATSGVAGPGGGTPEKPVGTVWFAWGTPERTEATMRRFDGDREAVRRQSVLFALVRLADYIDRM